MKRYKTEFMVLSSAVARLMNSRWRGEERASELVEALSNASGAIDTADIIRIRCSRKSHSCIFIHVYVILW